MVDIFDTSFDEEETVDVSANMITKGEDINITEIDPTMTNIVIGVGWDLNAFDSDALDLDISCFLLGKDMKTRIDDDFIFYNNMINQDEAIVHNGDSRTGAGDGDDESISIDLNKIPFDVFKVMFVFSIYKGDEKEQSMAGLRNSYIRLANAATSHEILRYDVTKDARSGNNTETGMFVASLNREGPKWHFEALGEPVDGGLAKIAADYGIIVQFGS